MPYDTIRVQNCKNASRFYASSQTNPRDSVQLKKKKINWNEAYK